MFMHESYRRLLDALAKKNMTVADLSRATGWSEQRIQNWKKRGVPPRALSELALRLGMETALSLLGEKTTMEIARVSAGPENVELVEGALFRIPKISYVQAGNWKEASDPYAIGTGDDYIYTHKPGSPTRFALTIVGDSMEPDFKEGDVIIVDPEVQPRPGDYVVAKNGQEEATFKKYRPRGLNERGEEYFELVPLNEDYPTLRSDLTTIEIIGTAVDVMKSLR